MLSQYVVSIIRTVVPAGVAFVLVWLADHFSVVIDSSTSDGLKGALVVIITGLYYALARAIERKWPALTWLLGSSFQPTQYAYAAGKHEAHV